MPRSRNDSVELVLKDKDALSVNTCPTDDDDSDGSPRGATELSVSEGVDDSETERYDNRSQREERRLQREEEVRRVRRRRAIYTALSAVPFLAGFAALWKGNDALSVDACPTDDDDDSDGSPRGATEPAVPEGIDASETEQEARRARRRARREEEARKQRRARRRRAICTALSAVPFLAAFVALHAVMLASDPSPNDDAARASGEPDVAGNDTMEVVAADFEDDAPAAFAPAALARYCVPGGRPCPRRTQKEGARCCSERCIRDRDTGERTCAPTSSKSKASKSKSGNSSDEWIRRAEGREGEEGGVRGGGPGVSDGVEEGAPQRKMLRRDGE